MDNCFRENKNRYVLGYLSYLIQSNLFDSIIINFLPIGHTHNDADQLFSLISEAFNNNNAFTIEQMHEVMKNKLNNRLIYIAHVESYPDISSYFNEEQLLNTIHGLLILINIKV